MSTLYYVAFILDRAIRDGDPKKSQRAVSVDAGIDLLAGPFENEGGATAALRRAIANFPRAAVLCSLAHHATNGDHPPARIEVIPLTELQLARYNARHCNDEEFTPLEWPPRCIPPEKPITNKGREERIPARSMVKLERG